MICPISNRLGHPVRLVSQARGQQAGQADLSGQPDLYLDILCTPLTWMMYWGLNKVLICKKHILVLVMTLYHNQPVPPVWVCLERCPASPTTRWYISTRQYFHVLACFLAWTILIFPQTNLAIRRCHPSEAVADYINKCRFVTCLINPFHSGATFSMAQDWKNVGNSLNPAMLVFIGKLLSSIIRWVPVCLGFHHIPAFFASICLTRLASSSERVNLTSQEAT